MLKKSSCVAAILLVIACGVQSSNVDANASVRIAGKAIGPDGHALANSKVVLVKELDLGEVVGGLFLTAASLGLACLADHPPAICAKNAHSTTTDDGGSYSFSVRGSETQGSFGVASTMEVITRVPARAGEINGAVAYAEFNVQTPSLTLPDLHVWQPTVKPGGRTSSSWQQVPASYGGSPSYALEFSDLHANQWWMTGPIRPGEWVDNRILEDLNGAFDVNARTRGTASGTTVDFTYVSGSMPIQGNAGPPPSRGDLCAPITNSGVGTFSPCPLTSGSLGAQASQFAGANGVVIDLGRDRTISLVVSRGCTGRCSLSIASDMGAWTDAGSISGMYATAPIALNSAARYVRITGSVGELRQISVW